MTVTERCTTFRYYCLMRVYEWLGLTVTIHGSAITFAKLPTLKRVSCNIAKCSTPLRIGNAGLDIYSGYDAKQPKNVSGYSSPMLNDFTGTDKVYIVRGYTYLHKGIDGPAWLTYQQFELDSFTNMLFLFCGRHRGHIKGLYLEKDGIIMLYKRLGQGVVPMAALGIRGEDFNAAAVPLAHGGAANRTAESPPSGDRIERSLSREKWLKTIENTGFSLFHVI